MQLLHKNQENFCLPTIFQMGPGKKNRPFWPTFWIFEPNRTQPRHPKIDFEISIFRFSKSDFRTSRDPCFRIFSKKCVFRGSVCENEKVDLGIAPQLFLSSNRARKRYKNIACSQRKVSRIRPKKNAKIDFCQKIARPKKNVSQKCSKFLWDHKKTPIKRCKKRISKIFFGTHFFSKIEKSKIWNPKISKVVWVGLSSEIQKVVKMGSFLRLDPLEKRFEGKNSPDFSLSNASIFGPFRFIFRPEMTFWNFRKFFELLGRCSKLSKGSKQCFWADF